MTANSHLTQMSMKSMGLWLFIVSEAFLFIAFIAARFSISGTSQPEHLNQVLGAILTVVLLISSAFAYRARKAAKRGDQTSLTRNLLITIVIGVLFVTGVGVEWAEGFSDFEPSTPYGTQFFSLTGIHVSHMITGLGILAFVYYNARRGRYTPDDHWGVEAGYRYWAFVDVAWLVIYPTLYIV